MVCLCYWQRKRQRRGSIGVGVASSGLRWFPVPHMEGNSPRKTTKVPASTVTREAKVESRGRYSLPLLVLFLVLVVLVMGSITCLNSPKESAPALLRPRTSLILGRRSVIACVQIVCVEIANRDDDRD
jgi:hypothetical protein